MTVADDAALAEELADRAGDLLLTIRGTAAERATADERSNLLLATQLGRHRPADAGEGLGRQRGGARRVAENG